jgi:hypothetical protein
MQQSLGQVEVSLWESIHAGDAYLASGSSHYAERYRARASNVEAEFRDYLELIETPQERRFAGEFTAEWTAARRAGDSLVDLVSMRNKLEAELFTAVDQLDDIIDFDIQAAFDRQDPMILEKERAIREVEVSLWEAIHAAEQHLGLADLSVLQDHSQATFQELMEKQFDDVEHHWADFVQLSKTNEDDAAAGAFEVLWGSAKRTGRQLLNVHAGARSQFGRFYDAIVCADAIIETKLQACIETRVRNRDRAAASSSNIQSHCASSMAQR